MLLITDYRFSLQWEKNNRVHRLYEEIPSVKASVITISRPERLKVDHTIRGPIIQAYPVRKSSVLSMQMAVPYHSRDKFLDFIGPIVDWIDPEVASTHLVLGLGSDNASSGSSDIEIECAVKSRTGMISGQSEVLTTNLEITLFGEFPWD